MPSYSNTPVNEAKQGFSYYLKDGKNNLSSDIKFPEIVQSLSGSNQSN